MLDGALALLAGGLGAGVVSALTPVLPAEAYVIAAALTHHRGLAVAVAVAVGQTVGKLVIFSAVRSAGRSRWLSRLRTRAWLAQASDVCLVALSGRAGWSVVLLSAVVGLPPLLAVAFIAGASMMRRRTFVLFCLLGRALRFGVVAAAPQAFASLFGA